MARIFGGRREIAFAALFVGLAAAAYFLYPLTNHGPNRIFLRTALDRHIPLVPIMVIPYVSLIPLIGIAGLVALRGGWRNLQGFALAVAIALAMCCAVYLVAQSYVDRPQVTGHGVLDQWVRDVYSADQPYDDFPSTHTTLASIITVYCHRATRRVGMLIAGWCVLIIASTVLIHQHYVADIGGGLVVAWVAVTVADTVVRALARNAVVETGT